MNLLRNKFKSILENNLEENTKEEYQEENEHSPSPSASSPLNEKLSVFFAATHLFGTLCKEAPNERAVYFNSNEKIIDSENEEEELLEAQTKEQVIESDESNTNIKINDKWKELIEGFEMQRKRDELETRLNELERDGVELEKEIHQHSNTEEEDNEKNISQTVKDRLKHLLEMMRLKNKMHHMLNKLNTKYNNF